MGGKGLNGDIVFDDVAVKVSMIAFLWYSLNDFCSEPETNDVQNRFATSIYNIKCRGNLASF